MVTIEGYLKKWTNFISRWKERYFLVENGLLRYSEVKNGPLKACITLKSSTITMDPNDPLRITITYDRQELVVRATSIIDKYRWVKALRDSQDQSLAGGSKENLENNGALVDTQRTQLKTPPRNNGQPTRAQMRSMTMPGVNNDPQSENIDKASENNSLGAIPDLNMRLAEVLDMQSKIDRIFETINETKNMHDNPVRTQIIELDGALFDLIVIIEHSFLIS